MNRTLSPLGPIVAACEKKTVRRRLVQTIRYV